MSSLNRDYILYKLKKADETLADAKILFYNGGYNSAINRCYYNAFYMVSALMYSAQQTAHTHSGLKTKFNLYFIKTGKIPLSLGKLYADLLDWLQESDYTDFIDFEKNFVQDIIEQVSMFNVTIREHISF